MAKAGVHTPTAATIHGRESDGVFSLMVSGGYDEDQDFGEEFLYAISGERYQRQKCIQGSEQFLIGINR